MAVLLHKWEFKNIEAEFWKWVKKFDHQDFQILELGIPETSWFWQLVQALLNKSILLPVYESNNHWMSGRWCRLWADTILHHLIWVYTICLGLSFWILTVLSTSLGKTFIVWRFIINENISFWLSISYQKPFVFSVSVFCSQIFTVKLNLRLKIGLTYAISRVRWFFDFLVLENIFYFSSLNFNYWCFTTTLWKFQKNWTSGTGWKSASKLPTL